MARVSATQAYEMRKQVFALSSQGLGQKAIAKQLGISRGSVRNYLARPLPEHNPSTLINAALEIKRQNPDYGPSQILDSLACSMGFDRLSPPLSEALLSKLITKNDLQKSQINHRGVNKPAYWLCNYDAPLKAFQIDTVKLVLNSGEQVELFTCIDVHSRAVWAEILPKDGSLSYCLDRCFQALGVPEFISTDNGRGFNLYTRGRLSEIAQFAFARGVQQFHFIPTASPWHNSLVERFHKTLKAGRWLHAGRDNCISADDVAIWLNDYLHYYNVIKSHSALGGTTCRKAPASVHDSYIHLPVVDHDFSFIGRLPFEQGIVSYTRRVNSRGLARVDAPCMLFNLRLSAAFGRMARFELDVKTGRGKAYLFLNDDDPSEMTEIGMFEHELGSECKTEGYIPIMLAASFDTAITSRPFNEAVELERERKHLRKGRRLPLPASYRYNELSNGEWEVLDKFGRVVTTSQHIIVDHLDEVLGDGWGKGDF